MDARRNPVYKVINRQLTICGADRRLFFLAVTMGAVIWNGLETILGAFLVTGVSLLAARYITANDPQLPRILINANRFRGEYDPVKLNRFDLTIKP